MAYDEVSIVNQKEYSNIFNDSSVKDYRNYEELDLNDDYFIRIISSIVLFFMVLSGIFGNLLVIHILGIRWKIQTPFNLFLSFVALADILFITARALNLSTHLFVGEFIFGDIACKLFAFFEYFGSILSILTIVTALIILQFRIGVAISIVTVIFLSIVTSLPALLESTLHSTFSTYSSDRGYTSECLKIGKLELWQELDNIFRIKIPVIILIIYFTLWIIEKMFVNFKTLGGFIFDRLLIIMTIVYIILWTPVLFFNNYFDYDPSIADIYKYTTHLICGLTAIYKPFLYMCMHEGLHREFNKFLQIDSQHTERNHFV